MAIAFHPLTVADVRRETPDAVSIAFAVPPHLAEDYRFTPGQHLTLRRIQDGVELRRSYSICTPTDGGELRIAVKRVAGGAFSGYAHAKLVPDSRHRRHAAGRAVSSCPRGERAGPTASACCAPAPGITPIIAIVEYACSRTSRRATSR